MFVIDLVSPFFKWCDGSCYDYGRLTGALAMAAAGVRTPALLVFWPDSLLSFQIERAFKMYHTGERVNVGQFSREMVGHMIDDYGANAKALSDRRWSKIMEIVGQAQNVVKDQRPSPNAASMQQKRRILYIASSD